LGGFVLKTWLLLPDGKRFCYYFLGATFLGICYFPNGLVKEFLLPKGFEVCVDILYVNSNNWIEVNISL